MCKKKTPKYTDADHPCFCLLLATLKYEEYGENFVNMLDGVFAFVLYDTRNNTYMAARDAIGVNPLYIGWGSDGTICSQTTKPLARQILHVSTATYLSFLASQAPSGLRPR
jgi:asparagine synthetase B (glutamine-hydrolysing)